MASAHQAASGIRKWALSKNLMRPLPAAVEATFIVVVPEAQFTEEAEVVMRKVGISSISYNETDNIVNVHTKRRVTQKDLTIIPTEIFGCDVVYAHGEVDECCGLICSDTSIGGKSTI